MRFVLVGVAWLSAAASFPAAATQTAAGAATVAGTWRLALPERAGPGEGLTRVPNPVGILIQDAAGHVIEIFMIPGREDTLRVNGRAWITRDETLLDAMTVAGKRPHLGIGIAVEECYFHCAKAFRRAGLWDARTWPDPDVVASFAQMLHDRTKASGTVEDLACEIEERTRALLY